MEVVGGGAKSIHYNSNCAKRERNIHENVDEISMTYRWDTLRAKREANKNVVIIISIARSARGNTLQYWPDIDAKDTYRAKREAKHTLDYPSLAPYPARRIYATNTQPDLWAIFNTVRFMLQQLSPIYATQTQPDLWARIYATKTQPDLCYKNSARLMSPDLFCKLFIGLKL